MNTPTTLVLLLIAIAVFFSLLCLKKHKGGCASCGKDDDACTGCPLQEHRDKR